jgi:hypothetical protein
MLLSRIAIQIKNKYYPFDIHFKIRLCARSRGRVFLHFDPEGLSLTTQSRSLSSKHQSITTEEVL